MNGINVSRTIRHRLCMIPFSKSPSLTLCR